MNGREALNILILLHQMPEKNKNLIFLEPKLTPDFSELVSLGFENFLYQTNKLRGQIY